MNHVRKANLPEKAVADLKLDEMTEVFWSDEQNRYVDRMETPCLEWHLLAYIP